MEMEDVKERNERTSLLVDSEQDMATEKRGESSHVQHEDRCEGRFLLYFLFACLEIVGLVCIILVCIWTKQYLGGFAWDGSGKMFNWHPVFMTVGLVFLYGNAAIVYRVCRNTEKHTVKLIHGGLNLAAFIFTVLGTYTVFAFHNHLNIPNMYSLHSWIGMGAILLYGCQLLFGFLGFLYPKFSENGRRLYLIIHVYFGGIILATVLAAALSGITEKMLFAFKSTYSKFPAVGIVANMYGVSLLLFVLIVGFILHNRNWKRVSP